MNEIKFSDLVLKDAPAAECDAGALAAATAKARPKAPTFEVVACSGADFAVRRSTAKTSRLLVFLVSQRQYYAKDELTSEVRSLSESSLAWALDGLGEPLPVGCDWLDSLPCRKGDREGLVRRMSHPSFATLAESGILRLDHGGTWHLGVGPISAKHGAGRISLDDVALIERIVSEKPALIRGVAGFLRELGDERVAEVVLGSLESVSRVEEAYGLDLAREFVSRYADYIADTAMLPARHSRPYISTWRLNRLLGIVPNRERMLGTSYHERQSRAMQRLGEETVRFEFGKLCDYLFTTSLHEGCGDVDGWIGLWSDTIEMQVMASGRVTDKYPQALRTAHDVLSLETACLKEEVDARLWSEAAGRMAELDFAPAGSRFAMTHPKTPNDMRAEGAALGHCVASYVRKVVEGRSIVMFCREALSPESPFYTIEVIPERMELVQIKGRFNSSPCDGVMEFVASWCLEKGIGLGTYASRAEALAG